MIVQKDNKWYLYSKDGKKKLGGPYKTKKEAEDREKQVIYFKNKDKRDMNEEMRFISEDISVRSEGEKTVVYGYAARYNQESRLITERGKTFVEVIEPGAFDEVLRSADDIPMVLDHDPRKLLARTSAGTLSLRSDDVGLYFEFIPSNTTLSRDVMEMLDRGEIRELSFKFGTTPQYVKWERTSDRTLKRRVKKMTKLLDVSLLQTRAAYPNTVVGITARDLEECEAEICKVEQERL